MFGRRRIKPPSLETIVTDPHGRVVGVRTPPPKPPEETKESRLWHRRKNLARTGEMDHQAALRNQCAAFRIDPASSPKH
jgi:hypothetical protein